MTFDRPLEGTAVRARSAAIEENPHGGPCHEVPLGTLVHRAGLMEQDEIEQALREAVHGARRLGDVLLERGLEERDLVRLLAAQHAQPFVDLTVFPIDYAVAGLLTPSVARTYCALPISRDEQSITIAVPDPKDARQRERLHVALHHPVRLVTATRADIKEAIGYLEPHSPTVSTARPPGPAMFRVLASLVDGREIVLGRVATPSAADELAQRIAAEARVGRMIEALDVRVDGTEIVSVEVVSEAGMS